MQNIGTLKRQHAELVEVVEQVQDFIKDSSTYPSTAPEIVIALSDLVRKIQVHLVMEDKILYPELFNSQDEEIKNTAHAFFDEMGGLREAFGAYIEKWSVPSKIIEFSEDFCNESASIFEALARRIKKEETELFPLLFE